VNPKKCRYDFPRWHFVSQKPFGILFCIPEVLKYVLEKLLIEAGVKVYYHALAAQPIVKTRNAVRPQRVAGVIVEAKEGRLAFRARVVIDATGDADICHRAGAPCVETDSE
jgi:flavin-dependent dehydrogenase